MTTPSFKRIKFCPEEWEIDMKKRNDLYNKIVLVAGGAGGIGRNVCLSLAKKRSNGNYCIKNK